MKSVSFSGPALTRFFGLLLALFFAVASANAQLPGSNDPSFNTADVGFGAGDGVDGGGGQNRVYAIAVQPDGKIIITGWFLFYNMEARRKIARLNADGTLDSSFNPGTGASSDYISAVALQPDGKIIVSGDFNQFNGIPRMGIARLHADGSVDTSFDPGSGFYSTGYYSGVRSILVQPDGKIVVAGAFTGYSNGLQNLVRLNADGSIDTSFNIGTGVNSPIGAAVMQPDGKIIIGGAFTSYNGTPRNRMARINSDGSLDTTFDPGTGADNTVNAVALRPDGKIIIGGAFTSYGGLSRNRLALINSNGSLDTTFDPGTGADNIVQAVALQPDGKIVVGGDFVQFNGSTRMRLARLTSNGALDTTLDPAGGPAPSPLYSSSSVTWPILTVAVLPTGKILLGGRFYLFNSHLQKHLSRLHPNGDVDTAFNPGSGLNGTEAPQVTATLIQPDGKIIVAGSFMTYNGVTQNQSIRLFPDGTIDQSFIGLGGDTTIQVACLLPDGKILVFCRFTNSNGSTTRLFARLHANGTLDTSFSVGIFPGPPPPASSNSVDKIVVLPDGKIIIAGSFSSYNNIPRSNIARLHANGTLDTSFDPGTGTVGLNPSGSPNDLVVQPDGKIIIVGYFDRYNGVPRSNIARINPDGSLDMSFNPSGSGASGWVRSIAQADSGKFIITGHFQFYSGVLSNNIARVNPDGTGDATFNPGSGITGSGYVGKSLVQADGKILIIGLFNAFNGTPRNNIARLNYNGSLDATFDVGSGTDKPVTGIAQQADGKVIIGGSFISYNGIGRNRLARVITGPVQPSPVTVNLPVSALCPGGTLSIPFIASSPANNGNYYTAVLSDPSGSFANAVSIGSVVGTTSGVIMATIPAGTPPATGYRIRVVSSSPISASPDNGSDLTVHPLPVIAATATPSTICSGSAVALSASGASTFSWAAGSGLAAQAGYAVTATPAAAGTHIYSVTGTSNNGCSQTATTTVGVMPLPVVSVQASATVICTSQTTTLTASGAASYSWSNGQTDSTISVSPGASTTYTVTGTTGSCSSTDTVSVVVHALPALSIVPANAVVCPGESISLTASGAASYLWTTNQTDSVINVAPGTATTYTVTGTNSSGCFASTATTVTIAPAIQVSATALPDSVAPGQQVTLLITNPASGTTYTWSGPDLNQTLGDTVTANPTTTGTVTYTVTASNGTCTGTATASVEVDPILLIQVTNWNWAISAGGAGGRVAAGNSTSSDFSRQFLSGEAGVDIAVHSGGTALTLGRFKGTATFGSTTLTSQGAEDMVLIRTDAAGNIQWVRQAGSPTGEEPRAVALDAAGSAYICGSFSGNAAFGASTLTGTGPENAFLVKYSSAGADIWARSAGGTGTASATDVAVDAQGYTTLTGYFTGSVTFGNTTLASAGNSDAFVVRYNSSGDVQWARQLGSTGQDGGYSIALDAQGNCYLTGTYKGSVGFGSTTLTSTGSDFARFFCKLDAQGNVLWAKTTSASGTAHDADAVAIDANGYAYLSGTFSGTAAFGTTTLSSAGSTDIYLLYFTNSGTLIWAKRAGGAGPEAAMGVAVDSEGLCYITGSYTGYAGFGGKGLSGIQGADIFVAKYDMGGNCLWARKAGGIADDVAAAVAVDAQGNAYLTGSYQQTATFGISNQIVSIGQQDLFIARLDHVQVLGTADALPASGAVVVFPNPFTSGLSVAFSAASAGKAEVVLNDVLGRQIFSRNYEVATGEMVLQVQPEHDLPQGIYLLQVRLGDQIQVVRVVKQ